MSDNELVKGDQVNQLYSDKPGTDVWTVVTVDGDQAWIYRIGDRGSRYDLIRSVLLLKKIEPRFEVGKCYRANGKSYIHVTEVKGNWAIGWWDDGNPWSGRQIGRNNWTEVQP